MTTQILPLDEEARETLQGMAMSIYLDGECYAFAIALSRGLGWPMVGLTLDHPSPRTPRHAAVYCSFTHTLHDVRGSLPQDSEIFGAPFSCRPPYVLSSVTEEDLHNVRIVEDRSIAHARNLAEAIWPEYPWINSRAKRVKAFVDDLEAVSRRHGLWLRSPYPTARPIISEEFGKESGYTMQALDTGLEFTIDRGLK